MEHCTENYVLIENGEIWGLKKKSNTFSKTGRIIDRKITSTLNTLGYMATTHIQYIILDLIYLKMEILELKNGLKVLYFVK